MIHKPPFRGPGEPTAKCDRCARITHLSELQRDGDYPNMLVCDKCYNQRHPGRDVRSVTDNLTVYNGRPYDFVVEDAASDNGPTEAELARDSLRAQGARV